MERVLYGIAAVIFAIAALVHALPSAEAFPVSPSVMEGSNPWQTFTGYAGTGDTEDLMTVPSDRVFVVTGASMQSDYCHLWKDGAMHVNGYSGAMSRTRSGFLSAGQGHVVYEGGSRVQVHGEGGCVYTVQGYLAHP